jgi:hypothetical protein
MSVPVSYSPAEGRFKFVGPGGHRELEATIGSAPSGVDVTAAIVDDASGGQFAVLQVVSSDVQRASNGRIIDVTEVGRSDGVTPLPVTRGQMVAVTVEFTAPLVPSQFTFRAVLEISGISSVDRFTWQPIRIPLSASVGQVVIRLLENDIEIQQGRDGSLGFTVRHVVGPNPIQMRFLLISSFPDGVTMDPVDLSVHPGPPAVGNFPLHVGDFAALGQHTLGIEAYPVEELLAGPTPSIRVTLGDVGVDTGLRWEQANPYAILINETQNAWHAGRVTDILPMGSVRGFLAASDQGGAWLVNRVNVATPLSNEWDAPGVRSFARGPDGADHVYAGGDGLYETDAQAQLPLLVPWRRIPFPGRRIYKILVLPTPRKIVIACDGGVLWSDIPQSGGQFIWQLATGLPTGKFSSVVAGANDSVVAAAWGSNPAANLFGIFNGGFTSGSLAMSRSAISGVDARTMFRTVLASCDSQRSTVYAIAADGASGAFLAALLKSTNSGQSWQPCGTEITGAPANSQFKYVPGNQADYNLCLAVHPSFANRVAFGVRRGPFVSTNGGTLWRAVGMHWTDASAKPNDPDFTTEHQHGDLHALAYDPAVAGDDVLYVGSDGGVVGVTLPEHGDESFVSGFNQQLLNLEVYGSKLSVASTGQTAALLGAATQDNGDIFCTVAPTLAPWNALTGNDGGVMLVLGSGDALHFESQDWPLRAAKWNGRGFEQDAPVLHSGTDIKKPVVEKVTFPIRHNADGELMLAVAESFSYIFGVFRDTGRTSLHLEFLDGIPYFGTLTALASYDGRAVFVGTDVGRIFLLEETRSVRELTVSVLQNANGDRGSVITRIVALADGTAYALLNASQKNYILGWNGQQWSVVNVARTRLPDTQAFTALEADHTTQPPTLFAATDNRVFESNNGGITWVAAPLGLPVRPHCTDLRFAQQSDGGHYMYLATYGRSVWRARLNPQGRF